MALELEPYLRSPLSRAGLFFALTFAVATALGVAVGSPRQGVLTGLGLGLVFAVLAAVFVRPAGDRL